MYYYIILFYKSKKNFMLNNMNSDKLEINSDKRIFVFRLFFAVLGWITFLIAQIFSILDTSLPWLYRIFGSYRFFTIQTNIMVLAWLSLALISYFKPNLLHKLVGVLKGAFTLYISITFIVFAIFLSIFYTPTGFEAFSNIVFHYITPIVFIIDWILTEKVKYKWKFLLFWLIYPVCYLCFAICYGTFTGDYIYFFLNINALGIPTFLMSFCVLVVFFLVIGVMYIGINRKWLSEKE